MNFNFFKKSNLEIEIESLENELTKMDATSEEYEKVLKSLKGLYEIKAGNSKWFISPEAIWSGLITIGCTLLVLNFEKSDTIVSKAFNRKW